jgi:hypothetical protein
VKTLLLTITLTFTAISAHAEYIKPLGKDTPNIAKMIKDCSRSKLETTESRECDIYVNGLMDGIMLSTLTRLNPKENPPVCLPDGTTTAQVRRAISTWLEAAAAHNPNLLNADGVTGVLLAMQQNFPCR